MCTVGLHTHTTDNHRHVVFLLDEKITSEELVCGRENMPLLADDASRKSNIGILAYAAHHHSRNVILHCSASFMWN